jgi:hypothetical protein
MAKKGGISFDIDVDDRDVQKTLKKMAKRIERAEGEHSVPMFPPEFMKKYTDANTFDDFVIDSGLVPDDVDVITNEILEKIPDKEFNEYVKTHSKFNDWDDMLSKAKEVAMDKFTEQFKF